MKSKKMFLFAFLSLLLLSTLTGCKEEEEKSDTKAITAFSFTAAANSALSSDVTATVAGTNITATVPFGTDVSALIATFTTDGSNVSVGSTTQNSGTTANDFTSAVTYTVTAADGTTQNYKITVIIADDSRKSITTFSFTDSANTALSSDVITSIDGTDITVSVPFFIDIRAVQLPMTFPTL